MLNLCFSFFILFVSFVFAFSDEIDLSHYERSIYSQNGEDGVLSKIFQLIEPISRHCIELGTSDGITGSNTYFFRLQGWHCLSLGRRYEVSALNLRKVFITAENINALFEKYDVPHHFDLLSSDLGYNDFYVWKAICKKYRPSVVVINYNASHLPHEDKVVKYYPYYCGDGTNYYGASILALYNLGRQNGYSLVYAEKTGTNLFFIRDDLLEEKQAKFKDVNNVEKIYRKGPRGRYHQDPKHWAYFSSSNLLTQQ